MRSNSKPLLMLAAAVLAGAVLATCKAPSAGGGAGLNELPFVDGGQIPDDPDAGVILNTGPKERCNISLDRFKVSAGTGAKASKIAAASELIGGPTAAGKIGDYLLVNDKIKVVIQGVDRHIGPQPYGATILDADLVRPAGAPGRDQFGETGLLYNFGRTVEPTFFEVLSDGNAGGSAILAMSGRDTANDYLGIRNQLKSKLGTVPAGDPYAELPLRITNYFILNPGEQKVKFLTALCNEGEKEVALAVGDLTDPGYTLEFFNPRSCTNGFGYGGTCFGLDDLDWYGYQGDGVAYGYAPYKPGQPTVPETSSAMMTIAGITGTIHGSPGFLGLLQWFDPKLTTRTGELRIPPGDARIVARDFVVGRDLGDVASVIASDRNALTGASTGEVSGIVTSLGKPVPQARVTFEKPDSLAAVFTTDDAGKFAGKLTAGPYTVSAWGKARIPSASRTVTLVKGSPLEVAFDFKDPVRTLTVNVNEVASGALTGPIPAKVTILCGTGVCDGSPSKVNKYTSTVLEPIPGNVQLIGFVLPSGSATFELPPGQYNVLVSRGPEYSIFPNNYPAVPGFAVDLRAGNGTVNANLARVVDTAGWMSADFHVHAVSSPDSVVDNDTRALSFAAEGMDILVSTDHDYVTDFAPHIKAIGAEKLLATVIGEEMSTMEFGHYNIFPLVPKKDDLITAGAMDWAGGAGPTFTVGKIFLEGRKMGAKTVHFNHPRGALGGFTHTKTDVDTLATHADPRDFRMAVPAGSSPADTLILSSDFNAMEVLNPGSDDFDDFVFKPNLNDWFTLLSRGLLIAGTGVSDTHHKFATAAGYWRTFVNMGTDSVDNFSPSDMCDNLNALKAVASNGPFVTVKAARVDSTGKKTSPEATIGGTVDQGTDDVQITVSAQVPEYTDLTKVELYMHLPSDDARCVSGPDGYIIDAASPNARTTRVACGGKPNLNWPLASITASRDLTQGGAVVPVTVTSFGGVTYKRWQATATFKIKAPTTDNWIVALVYGSKTLFPLVYGKSATVKPFAFSNPIFVDADGGGYDHPPFSAPPLPRPPVDDPRVELKKAELPMQEHFRKDAVGPAEFLRAWGPMSDAK